VLVLIYLDVMRGSGMTALRSVDLILFGKLAVPFYVGAVLLGLILPIAIGSFAYFGELSRWLLVLVGLFSLLGDLAIIYCVAKAGIYRPLDGCWSLWAFFHCLAISRSFTASPRLVSTGRYRPRANYASADHLHRHLCRPDAAAYGAA